MVEDPRDAYGMISRDFSQPHTSKAFWAFVLVAGAVIGAVILFGYIKPAGQEKGAQEEAGELVVAAQAIDEVAPDIETGQEPDEIRDFDRLLAPTQPLLTNKIVDKELRAYTEEGGAFMEAYPDQPSTELLDHRGDYVGEVANLDPQGAADQSVTFRLRPELQERYNHERPFTISLDRLEVTRREGMGYALKLTEEQTRFLAAFLDEGARVIIEPESESEAAEAAVTQE